MSKSRTKKVVKLGIAREPDWLYFIRGSDVWRIAFKVRNHKWIKDDRSTELVACTQFIREPEHLYYLDKDGDISCVDRRLSRHKHQRLIFE